MVASIPARRMTHVRRLIDREPKAFDRVAALVSRRCHDDEPELVRDGRRSDAERCRRDEHNRYGLTSSTRATSCGRMGEASREYARSP